MEKQDNKEFIFGIFLFGFIFGIWISYLFTVIKTYILNLFQ